MTKYWYLLIFLVLFGCAEPPMGELDEVQTVVLEAREAGATDYSPTDLSGAEEKLTQAEAEIDAQNQKLRPWRNFSEAAALLAQAKEQAVRARNDASAWESQIEAGIKVAIEEARAAISRARIELESAPTGKDSLADLEMMRIDLETLDESLNEAENSLESEEFDTSRRRVEEILAQAEEIEVDLRQAKRKVGL